MNAVWNEFIKVWNAFVKWWFEFRGRRRPAPQFTFDVNEIRSREQVMRVSALTHALYINLHPTLYAVAVSSDGKIQNLKGGFNHPLNPGRYAIYYIDKQDRISAMPMVSETTKDGSQVSLELVITYRVSDPIKALEVQQPVDSLFVFVQSDLKDFIRSHKYDEIVGSANGQTIDDRLVARYIKAQHAGRHQISRLFVIENIVVEEKVGDPKLTEIMGNFQIQQRQQIAESEITKQNQELQKKVAEQEAMIKQIKTEAEAAQQKIVQEMQLKGMELENARAKLQARQEVLTRAMDAIGQAFSSPNYPMDPREVEIIRELIGELMRETGPIPDAINKQESQSKPEKSSPANAQKIDKLTDILLHWQDRRRS